MRTATTAEDRAYVALRDASGLEETWPADGMYESRQSDMAALRLMADMHAAGKSVPVELVGDLVAAFPDLRQVIIDSAVAIAA